MTPCTLASCHILISKQEDDSTIRVLGYNRCVTGKRSRDENYAVRFRQSAENRSRARDTQPTRGVSDELARGCKRWHLQAPRRRYWKKSSLWVYVSPPILSHTTETSNLSRIKCGRYIFIKKCVRSFIEVRKLCLIIFPLVFVLRLYNNWITVSERCVWWRKNITQEHFDRVTRLAP